uniref:C-type lectin domain-containing protein n=1 Tax=Cyclopterus lumpus TaxID=8103 RepID=A0A8C3G059_CYCLU
MEEELHYVAVTFKTEGISAHEIIYDEVTTCKEHALGTDPAIPEKKKTAPRCSALHLLTAALGVICVVLVSAVVSTLVSEQHRENINLTAQNLQMWTEKTDLERRAEELTKERDRLSWTVGVILDFENFPVNSHCPQKVCTPCLDGWLLFQSNCYMFSESDYYHGWRTWEGSRDQCRQMKAQLVVIGSQEEQEFINNHTHHYNDDNHGYWIGLIIVGNQRLIVFTRFWRTEQAGYRVSCGLSLPGAGPLANWVKESAAL